MIRFTNSCSVTCFKGVRRWRKNLPKVIKKPLTKQSDHYCENKLKIDCNVRFIFGNAQ